MTRGVRGIWVLTMMALRRRVVRYALVGGLGVPINMLFLWFFHRALGLPAALAWFCAFEPSTLINFYINQRFTYHEQKHLCGWDWPRRALLAQVSSLPGQVVSVVLFGLLLHLGIQYLPADAAGIVVAFFTNYLLASRFVFTPARAVDPAAQPASAA